MFTFEVTINTESVHETFEVEADTADAAVDVAMSMYEAEYGAPYETKIEVN